MDIARQESSFEPLKTVKASNQNGEVLHAKAGDRRGFFPCGEMIISPRFEMLAVRQLPL